MHNLSWKKALRKECFLSIRKTVSASVGHSKSQRVGWPCHTHAAISFRPPLSASLHLSLWLLTQATAVRQASPYIFHEQFIALPFPLLCALSQSTRQENQRLQDMPLQYKWYISAYSMQTIYNLFIT